LSRDQKFFDLYSLVIGVLAAFALAIFVLAMKMSDLTQGNYVRESPEYQQAVAERLRPLGQVYMPGEETEASAPVLQPAAEPEPVAAALTGPQVYNSACLACHGAGVGGAPILGDVDAWKARIAQGEEVLYEHAINGYQGPSGGYMPPKGGRLDLSDDEVKLAVDYILAQTE